MFPVAGGTAQIPQLSHGVFTSFMVSWIAWLSALTMAPIEVLAILQYASTYFTSLTHIQNGIPVLTHLGMIAAFFLMLLMCIVNAVSYNGLIRSNFIIFTFKVVVIVLTVVVLIKTNFNVTNFASTFTENIFSYWLASYFNSCSNRWNRLCIHWF